MSTKRLIISDHAQFELNRRSIKKADVDAVVRRPQQVLSSKSGRTIFQSVVGAARRMLLRVVVKETADAYFVITAYRTSKIAKYWRPS